MSTSLNDNAEQITRLFGRQRSIHQILGGGKVADILLWRKKALSGAIFYGILAIWFLFEVVEYNLVTFLCHLTITIMLVIFIWRNGAIVFKWNPPEIPNVLLEESMVYKEFCIYLNIFVSRLIYISYGKDIKLFFSAILTALMLSMVGNYITTLNLLFTGFVCMGTLPYLYEKHEQKIDNFFNALHGKVSEVYKTFDQNVVSKIPKWPLQGNKLE